MLRGATQVVTLLFVRDRKKCVGGPIAVQSQSVVGAHVTQSTRPVIKWATLDSRF